MLINSTGVNCLSQAGFDKSKLIKKYNYNNDIAFGMNLISPKAPPPKFNLRKVILTVLQKIMPNNCKLQNNLKIGNKKTPSVEDTNKFLDMITEPDNLKRIGEELKEMFLERKI